MSEINLIERCYTHEVKRYTHEAEGTVLSISRKDHNDEYRIIEFDDCRIHVPWYIAHTIQVGDNIHAYFNQAWSTDMADMECVVASLNAMADVVFKDYKVSDGYRELLIYIREMHHGFWIVEHI